MNILDKIKKNWNFGKSIEQNAIYFNTKENQAKKTRNKMILLSLFIVGLSFLFHNPALSFLLLIGAITYGSEYIYSDTTTYYSNMAMLDSTHFVVVCYSNALGRAVVGTIDGETISFGSLYTFYNGGIYNCSVSVIDSTHFVVAYGHSVGGCIIGTISNGNEIAYGSAYNFTNGQANYVGCSLLDSTHFVVGYHDVLDGGKPYCIIGTISNDDEIAYGSAVAVDTTIAYEVSVIALSSTAFIIGWNSPNDSAKGKCAYCTVSSGNSISRNSPYSYNTGTRKGTLCKLDSTHFVVVYKDTGNSNKGTSIIGTLSGTTISYGNETLMVDAATDNYSIIMIDSTNFVVSYSGSDGYGYSVYGTVSGGNSISYGDAYVFNSAGTIYTTLTKISSSSFLVAYTDTGNSNKGTVMMGTYSAPSTFIPRTMWFN